MRRRRHLSEDFLRQLAASTAFARMVLAARIRVPASTEADLDERPHATAHVRAGGVIKGAMKDQNVPRLAKSRNRLWRDQASLFVRPARTTTATSEPLLVATRNDVRPTATSNGATEDNL